MPRKTRRTDQGFTLVEVVIALSVMVLTLIGLISGISYASRLNANTLEDEMAMRGAQKMIETMRSYPTKMVWACFNATAGDAALLPTAVGWNNTAYPEPVLLNRFEVEGLTPAGDTVGGYTWDRCGLILFPGNQTTTLVEITDTTDPMYDANGTDLDADNVTGETLTPCVTPFHQYNLLPVTITIRWKGISGKRAMMFRYLLLNVPTSSASDFKYPGQP